MSRHVPRHARWSRLGPNEYRSGSTAVRFERGAWWGWVSYRQRASVLETEDDLLPPWQSRSDRLGPFKRPRNAMMAAEDHARLLKRRLGADVEIDTPDRRE
jgi:hypothetical protein